MAKSAVRGRILPNFELIRDIMVVLHTCNNEEDPIKNEDTRVLTRLYVFFFRLSRAANSEDSNGILPEFELIQAFIVVLVTCKNEEDPINQRTNGPVNAHLISWPSKAQNIQNLENIL